MALWNLLDDLLDRTVVGGYDRLGYLVRSRTWNPDDLDVDLSGRTAVVTGANSGLGLVTARELLRRGARVHMICRDPEKGEAARRSILDEIAAEGAGANTQSGSATAAAPGTVLPGTAVLHIADMGDPRAVRRAAAQIGSPVHILVNNAGALHDRRSETAAGVESTFAVGVLGYFLLTELLLPALIAADMQQDEAAGQSEGAGQAEGARARIVNVSSGGMYPVGLNVEDLQWQRRPFDGVRAYAEAKRAEVVLTEIWARRCAGRPRARGGGLFFAAMHPGWADTPGVQNALPTFRALTRLVLRSPAEGADTILWLAVAPGLDATRSGRFWCDRRERPRHRLNSTRNSATELKRFWDECRRLTGVGEELPEDFFEGLASCAAS